MIDFKQDTKTIVKEFMRIVNNFSFKPKELAEELKKSKEMRQLDFYWLVTISSSNYMTDGRNEIAARKGRELAEIPFIKKKMEKLPDDMYKLNIALEISREHKTLQQTFTGFVFYHILLTSTEKQKEQIIDRMGEDFYIMPLI